MVGCVSRSEAKRLPDGVGASCPIATDSPVDSTANTPEPSVPFEHEFDREHRRVCEPVGRPDDFLTGLAPRLFTTPHSPLDSTANTPEPNADRPSWCVPPSRLTARSTISPNRLPSWRVSQAANGLTHPTRASSFAIVVIAAHATFYRKIANEERGGKRGTASRSI